MQRRSYLTPDRRIRSLIVLLMLSTSLLAACDSNSPSTPSPIPQAPSTQTASPPTAQSTNDVSATPITTSAQSTTIAGDTATPAATNEAGTDAPGSSTVPSSVDKISAGEQAGKLEHDTALLYEIYAYFQPDKLPAEYSGDDSHIIAEGGRILGELASRFDRLSPDVKAAVTPFLLRPDDHVSFWNQPTGIRADTGRGPVLAAVAQQSPATWAHIDSPDSMTRIWYPEPDQGEGLAPAAAQLANEIDSSGMSIKALRCFHKTRDASAFSA
ncbi:MAG: hypothetical protein ABI670_21665 [Chloroflexota bacterium]